eukprot:GEMP01021366.1.p1 GENE.GEMP01021366.1~~GEMP01021366.1.p1  ORF type:complete len:472 (+),score=141.66 GEMP01021366.1:176-1591(+)
MAHPPSPSTCAPHKILQAALGQSGFRATYAPLTGVPWIPPSALKSKAPPPVLPPRPPRQPLAAQYADAARRTHERLQQPPGIPHNGDAAFYSTATSVAGFHVGGAAGMRGAFGRRRPHTAPAGASVVRRRDIDDGDGRAARQGMRTRTRRCARRKARTPVFRAPSPARRGSDALPITASPWETMEMVDDGSSCAPCASRSDDGRAPSSPVHEFALQMDRCPDPPPAISSKMISDRFSPWRPLITALSPSRIATGSYPSSPTPSSPRRSRKTPPQASRSPPSSVNQNRVVAPRRCSQVVRLWRNRAMEYSRRQQVAKRASEQCSRVRDITRHIDRSLKMLKRTLDFQKEPPKQRPVIYDFGFTANLEQENEEDEFFAPIEVSPEEQMIRDLSKKYNVHIDKVEQLYEMFSKYDEDGTGCIDQHEVVSLLTELQDGQELRPDEVTTAMLELDQDRSGVVEFTEFASWVMEQQQ